MASWTELTTTYTTNTLITVDIWNKLAGYSGNTQYLKDLFDYYSFNEYNTYGFRTETSFTNIKPVISTDNSVSTFSLIDANENADNFPDETLPHFFDESNTAYRKIRKSGKYIIAAHYNTVTEYNGGSGNDQSQTFDFTINDVSISKTNFSGSNVGSTTSWNEATVTPIHNFYMGRLQEDDILLAQILDPSYLANITVATFSGSNTSFIDNQSTIFSKSPVTSTLYLNTSTLDVSPPALVYSLVGGEKIANNTTTSVTEWTAYTNKGSSSNSITAIDQYFSNKYNSTGLISTYYSNSWATSFDSTYALKYTAPVNIAGTSPKSIFTSRRDTTITVIGNAYAPNIWPYYMIFAIKSFDLYNNIPTNTEQNIFSIDLYDISRQEYIGTPFQLTANWVSSGPNSGLTFNMRLYTNVTQIRFPELTANTRMLFGLQVAQVLNNFDIIWPKFIIDNTEIASVSSWVNNLTTYSLDYTDPTVNGIINQSTIGGVEYYSVNGTVSNNAIYSGYYFIGDYKLTDTYLNGGTVTTKEKEYIWKYIPPLVKFTKPNYSFLVSYTDAGMIVGSWTFGSLIGLA